MSFLLRADRAATIVLAILLLPVARGDEWPQWMGPRRDNVWREEGILERFPQGGPKVLWRAPVKGGYAGPAVAGGKVFVTDFSPEGNLPGDNLPLPQGRYPLKQHGFARDLPWTLTPLDDGRGVALDLREGSGTLPHFPFAFSLRKRAAMRR